jgi:threonine/homoserine/homoserine lactone efflux protein
VPQGLEVQVLSRAQIFGLLIHSMNYWAEFSTIALINLLAVISPGPAFALVVRNGFKYSKHGVVYTALGLGLGVALHITNALIGIGYLVSQSTKLFILLKYIGACYLIYIGYKSLVDKSSGNHATPGSQKEDLAKLEAFKMGFFTNATNPKALVFFMSLYTVIVNQSTPLFIKTLYGVEMVLAEFLWFTLVGSIITHSFVQNRIGKFQVVSVKIMGAILVFFGLKIFFS